MRICTIYECSRAGDRRCCVDCDIVPCPGRCQNHPDRCRVWSEEQKQPHGVKRGSVDSAKVVKLARQGKSQMAIAEILGCSVPTVAYHLKKMGCTKPKGGAPSG